MSENTLIALISAGSSILTSLITGVFTLLTKLLSSSNQPGLLPTAGRVNFAQILVYSALIVVLVALTFFTFRFVVKSRATPFLLAGSVLFVILGSVVGLIVIGSLQLFGQ